jgi:hypothetical protein
MTSSQSVNVWDDTDAIVAARNLARLNVGRMTDTSGMCLAPLWTNQMHYPDWTKWEAALAAHLPASPMPGAAGSTARAESLADLGRYAGSVVRAARADPLVPPSDDRLLAARDWLMRPVFICGHHRSGTTLLQNLLDGHPDLLVLPAEATYFSSFRDVANDDPTIAALDRFVAEWVTRFIDPNYEPHFKLGRSSTTHNPYLEFARRFFAWQFALRRAWPEGAQFAALLALVVAYGEVVGVASPRMWVEKTPLNERFLRRFAAFGEARFVHVVRNPDDSLVSLLTILRAAGAEPAVAEHASDIGHSLRLARRHARRHPQSYLVVKYEELIAPAAREMDRVCRFLQITPHVALLEPTTAGIAVRANSAFQRTAAGVVRAAAAGAHLTAREARMLGAGTSGIARAFGYRPTPTTPLQNFLFHVREVPFALKRLLRGSR